MLGGKRAKAPLKPYSYTSTFQRSASHLMAALWNCPCPCCSVLSLKYHFTYFFLHYLRRRSTPFFFLSPFLLLMVISTWHTVLQRGVLAGCACVGSVGSLFPWFGLSPDLWVLCRRHPFKRAVPVLPRPIKGKDLIFFTKVFGWKIFFLMMIWRLMGFGTMINYALRCLEPPRSMQLLFIKIRIPVNIMKWSFK